MVVQRVAPTISWPTYLHTYLFQSSMTLFLKSPEYLVDVSPILLILLQLDCRSAGRTRTIICRRTGRATTLLRPPLESSRQGESKSSWYIFVCKHYFWPLFKITFQIMPKQKYTRQIQIFLVDYSSSEISDPSEVPRINDKFIFTSFQNNFPNNVWTKIDKPESDLPRRTLFSRGLRSFWGASVRW